MGTTLGLLAVLLLVLANGFFVAAEFGLVAVDRGRVDQAAEQGNRSASRVQRLVANLSFHLSGAQLGITASTLILGFIAKPTLAALIERALAGSVSDSVISDLSIVLAIALATGFQMVVGELVPKTIAIDRPYEVSTLLSPAIRLWGLVGKPVIATFDAAANWLVRRLGMEPAEELEHIRSLDEIERLIVSSGAEGTLDSEDVTLLQRSIRLGEKRAADALIPRVEVVSLNHDDTAADLAATSISSGFSRFPVYGEDADDVMGVVHIRSIHAVPRGYWPNTPVSALMNEPAFIPESVDLDHLLQSVRESRNHLAIVIDEHGGTNGIITLEDILEEIVGEIDDEYDVDAVALTRVEEDGAVLVAGSLHQDELLDACGFEMPDGEYDTLAGFVLNELGRIPAPGARFDHAGWRVEVVAMDRRRIASVRLVAPQPTTPEDPAP
ncbi:MAG: hemolysin family protein [Acidimicrobiales bacterium]